MSKQFGIKYRFHSKMELAKTIINIHLTLFPPPENLHELEKEALAYYILYGYNSETSHDIADVLSKKIKKGYARGINSTLQSKGFLIKDIYNKHMRHLSPEMKRYKNLLSKLSVNKQGKTFKILPIIFESNG